MFMHFEPLKGHNEVNSLEDMKSFYVAILILDQQAIYKTVFLLRHIATRDQVK